MCWLRPLGKLGECENVHFCEILEREDPLAPDERFVVIDECSMHDNFICMLVLVRGKFVRTCTFKDELIDLADDGTT